MQKPWEASYSDKAKAFDLANLECHTLTELIDVAVGKYANRRALTTILPTGADTSVTYM